MPLSSSTYSLLVYNLLKLLKDSAFRKFFCDICSIQNVIGFAIIIISKNKKLLMDICSVKLFHNGLIQQPEKLNFSLLHAFLYCSYLIFLTSYSGTEPFACSEWQQHLLISCVPPPPLKGKCIKYRHPRDQIQFPSCAMNVGNKLYRKM